MTLPILFLLTASGFEGLGLLHLILCFLFLGLDGIQHLPGLLGRNLLLLRLPVLLILLILLLILIILLILPVLLILIVLLVLLVLLILLILLLISLASALLVLEHLLGVDVVFLGLEVGGVAKKRLLESLDRS